ncbi:RsmE family RNA methyltransferase [Desulforegula conservatrix]|uniref:RsmE family RNA methyltransferase n=1 Tax=Desulforegula conservatrix TaxID=153026 RepID=UPI00041963EA|nr:RsmE family RNA methyltransferase [Desulforegula conservatrix]
MITQINNGGMESIIRVCSTPELEQDIIIPESSFPALRAWFARPGEIITISDHKNRFYRARLAEWDGTNAVAHVFQSLPENHEPRVKITVFQAIPEKERFELILQKLTEIGVSAIVPFVSRKSLTIEERDSSQKKSHKWPEILVKAAKQCRRGIIPGLGESIKWDNLLETVHIFSKAAILSEHNGGVTITEAFKNIESGEICLIVGPEGGFLKNEISEAAQKGVVPVSLGSRILRTETASMVAASLAVYITGGFS